MSYPPARRLLFVNLPVADLRRAMKFFAALGFSFHPRYTDERGACMIISQGAFVLLLTRTFFERFARRRLGDARSHAEGYIGLSCRRRDEVVALLDRAVAAGGTRVGVACDDGLAYASRFDDLDGHSWELSWRAP